MIAAHHGVDDAFARTSVPGLFAAGDLSAQTPQVAAAVAAGSQAGAAVVQHLLGEDFRAPGTAVAQAPMSGKPSGRMGSVASCSTT